MYLKPGETVSEVIVGIQFSFSTDKFTADVYTAQSYKLFFLYFAK
jgi:hypothetical protein